jgi:hypothetical protein
MAIGNPITLTNNVASKIISVTATADQTLFTVTGGYRINQLAVFRNGVRLVNGADFTANDGATVTLLTAANNNDSLEFQVFDTFRVDEAIHANEASQTINGNLTLTGDLTASGTITGGSFSGDGSGLTGVASTDNIITGTAATFTGGINAAQSDVSVRNLTGVAATFTGVLTYEDVTNIDSVGIVTARTGVRVTDGGLVVTSGDITAGPIDISSSTGYGAQVDMAANAATIKAQCQQTASQFTLLYEGYQGTNRNFYVSAVGNAEFAGIVTATSYRGDGSGLTGVANTDNVNTGIITAQDYQGNFILDSYLFN